MFVTFLVGLLQSIISNLATSKISNFLLVSVAEETGFKLALPGTPKTGFLRRGPYYNGTTLLFGNILLFQCMKEH